MKVFDDIAQAARPGDRAEEVYTVGRLNREVAALLESGFPSIRVEGEISNLACPSSGHIYFTLKDESAQVRCAMFRSRNQSLSFRPANGAHVIARARVGLYQPRGDYQLIVDGLEEAGDGALRRAFEALKTRLAAEGLFDVDRKRPIPALPRRIGVITSPTGAAIRDVLTVLGRRFAAIPVLVYPVPVQGATAAGEIARMIRTASARAECDVLILCRGGGSLEDLWAFNEEVVARAIADCEIPIVSGVGHEVDVTIADFVADLRAPTPSGAAENTSPDAAEWQRRFAHIARRLEGLIDGDLARRGERVRWLVRTLERCHPGLRLRQQAQRLDELEQRMGRAARAATSRRLMHLRGTHARLLRHAPSHRLAATRTRSVELARRITQAIRARLERLGGRLEHDARSLDALSPLSTLGRGYAIVSRPPDGHVLTDAREVRPGDEIAARLARGRLTCTVTAAFDDDRGKDQSS